MANLKRIELSDEVMLSFLKHINIPVDSVITWIGKSKQGIEIYINSKEFEETKELCTPDLFVIKYGKSREEILDLLFRAKEKHIPYYSKLWVQISELEKIQNDTKSKAGI